MGHCFSCARACWMSRMDRYPKKTGKVHGDRTDLSRQGRMSNTIFVKKNAKKRLHKDAPPHCFSSTPPNSQFEARDNRFHTCISMRGGRFGSAAPISRMICARRA